MKAQKRVQVSIQSAFGCGFEGPIPAERVLSIVDRYLAAGIRNISLADTAGHAYPPQVEALFGEILKRDGQVEWPAISTTPTAWAWPTATRP